MADDEWMKRLREQMLNSMYPDRIPMKKMLRECDYDRAAAKHSTLYWATSGDYEKPYKVVIRPAEGMGFNREIMKIAENVETVLATINIDELMEDDNVPDPELFRRFTNKESEETEERMRKKCESIHNATKEIVNDIYEATKQIKSKGLESAGDITSNLYAREEEADHARELEKFRRDIEIPPTKNEEVFGMTDAELVVHPEERPPASTKQVHDYVVALTDFLIQTNRNLTVNMAEMNLRYTAQAEQIKNLKHENKKIKHQLGKLIRILDLKHIITIHGMKNLWRAYFDEEQKA